MFNRSYQQRAVREAGGGRKVAADVAMRLPWAGIFEPWRPLVLTAAIAESATYKSHNAAKRCEKSSGRLQGVQLELFAESPNQPPIARESPADSRFPLLAGLEIPLADDERPLADLFPEAYL
jgi:hypothetical protein